MVQPEVKTSFDTGTMTQPRTVPQGPGSRLDADTVDGFHATSSTKVGPNLLVATGPNSLLPASIIPAAAGATFADWTPTFGGFSTAPTVSAARFIAIGKLCVAYFVTNAAGTSNATTFTITLPVAAAKTQYNMGFGVCTDNGSLRLDVPVFATTASSATMTLYRRQDNLAWTNSGAKACDFTVVYETV